jgi:hypothetical protein
LLPDDIVKAALAQSPATKRVSEFDVDRHATILATDKARILVRKLTTGSGDLFALAYKDPATGMCTGLPLKSVQQIMRQVFFFREWVTDTNDNQSKKRHDTWKRDLNIFVEKYLDDHADGFLNEPPEPATHSPLMETTAAMSQAYMMQNIILFDMLKRDEFLEAAKEEGHRALGHAQEEGKMQDEENTACAVIRNLFLGRDPLDSYHEAKEVAAAFAVGASRYSTGLF